MLSDGDRRLLETAADWHNFEFPGEPPFLNDLAALQIRLLDRLTPTANDSITAPVANPDIESLLEQVPEALTEQVRQSKSGVEAVVEEYLNDSRSDPNGVRQMLRNYTVVLAATCQQAVGKEMESTTGNVDSVFETVIIDEAARANPLDLFIPMAKAQLGTVDAFQGKEFDVVFLSVTRSNNIRATPHRPESYRRKYGFLLLENRLCVAMSRQQRLLIATGDLEMVRAEAVRPESERQAIRELIAFYQKFGFKTPSF